MNHERQINRCKNIIDAIDAGNYHDASIQIRFNLNDSSYVWYKDPEFIKEDQISNLFIDIEENFKNDYCRDFFKRTIKKLQYFQEHDI